MLLIRRKNSKGKYQNGPLTSIIVSKKVDQKLPFDFYLRINSKAISVSISIPEDRKKVYVCYDTEPRNSTRINDIEVEFREITL